MPFGRGVGADCLAGGLAERGSVGPPSAFTAAGWSLLSVVRRHATSEHERGWARQ